MSIRSGWRRRRRPTRTGRGCDLPDDYFLFVGTREPRKDLPTLLAAYRAAARSRSGPTPPTLLLVGPAGWGPELAQAPGVQMHDYAPVADLPTIVAGARALVMPSRDEGFGLPALEALATGTAVIISDIPALRRGHRRSGAAVFPVGDVDGAGRGSGTTGCNGRRRPGRRAARRRVYAAEWTWDRCADRTVQAYRIAAG